MKRTTCTMLALAATMGLGMSAMAQESNRPGAAPNENLQQGDRTGVGTPMREGSGNTSGTGMSGMSGSAGDMAIAKQLTDIRSNPSNASDRLFALHAGMGNLLEVRMSEMVARKAQDPQVKELAQMMMRDHAQANEKLQPIAKALNVDLPDQLPMMKQQELAIMEAMPSDKLEKAYLMQQKAIHAKDITSFADHANSLQDAQLKAYAQETLPKLRTHGQHLLQVAQAKGISGDMVTMDRNTGGSNTAGHHMNQGHQPTAGERRE